MCRDIEFNKYEWINFRVKGKKNKSVSIEYTNKVEGIRQVTLGNFDKKNESIVRKDLVMTHNACMDAVEFASNVLNKYRSRGVYKDKFCIDFLSEDEYLALMNFYKSGGISYR